MGKKEFAVFGLGRFGMSIAIALADSGCEVMAVDDDEEKVNLIADKVTHAVKADVTDPEIIKSFGIKNFDGAIIAIAANMETSIMVTILVKEAGAKYILAKAQSEIHARILKKLGADVVIQPEKEMGIRMANRLISGHFLDAIELSSTFSIIELSAPQEWQGKSLKELDLRARNKINVIAIKNAQGEIDPNPNPDKSIESSDVLIVIGKNDKLIKLTEAETK